MEGKAILYADRETEAMRLALAETRRRREKQAVYNAEHGITPQSIIKNLDSVLSSIFEMDYYAIPEVAEAPGPYLTPEALAEQIAEVEKQMYAAAASYHYEQAAELRDKAARLRERLLKE